MEAVFCMRYLPSTLTAEGLKFRLSLPILSDQHSIKIGNFGKHEEHNINSCSRDRETRD